MDTAESASLVVGVKTLDKWSEMDIPEYSPPVIVKDSPFPCLPHLNEKLRVCERNGLNLDVMAIVHPTSENLKEATPFTEALYNKAGPDLMREIETEVFSCRTGDAKLSKGCDLPARYIIHTVGPRYNIKYKTAAESALYNCYRQTLLLAKENHISSVALGAIHTSRRGYPPEEGAHIAIRTLRRLLEKHGDAFETIVLTIHSVDESIYPDLLRLYFPRSKEEEQWAVDLLPDDIGNEEGEPVIPERQIRITGNPTGRSFLTVDGDDSNTSSLVSEQSSPDSDEINARGHAFTSIEKDPDAIKAENMKKRSSEEPSDFDLRHRYERLLRKARTEDLSDFAAHRCVYQSGVDIFDRPIIVFVARNFPATTVNLGKALLYIIHLLDPIVSRDYVIVYFHTLCTSANQPSFSWLKSVYNSLDTRYRQNLKSFYVVHPTFWSKGAFQCVIVTESKTSNDEAGNEEIHIKRFKENHAKDYFKGTSQILSEYGTRCADKMPTAPNYGPAAVAKKMLWKRRQKILLTTFDVYIKGLLPNWQGRDHYMHALPLKEILEYLVGGLEKSLKGLET